MREKRSIKGRAKRLLASLLAGAMLLTGLPTAAFASGSAGSEKSATGVNTSNWQFTYFGPSTSSSRNTHEVKDDGQTIVLNSCTYTSGGAIGEKGGKFVADAPGDGISLYYTTIDPSTTNFYLQADVTIDYMNPSPDGQEGFALMIRDLIGKQGDQANWESNQVSVTATKLPCDALNGSAEVKDAIGVRAYTGIKDTTLTDKSEFKVYRQAFDGDGATVAQGKTYRVSLEKTDNAYITTQYDTETGAVIGQYTLYIAAKDSAAQSVSSYDKLNDPMLVQDQTAYVGFAAARGMNVTITNIVYTTSAWSAAGWEQQPTTYVATDYEITSPDTSAEDSYTLIFKANADGTADIYQDGELKESGVAIKANTAISKTYAITGSGSTFEVKFTPSEDYKPGDFKELDSYEMQTITKTVTRRTLGQGNTIYVTPTGEETNGGTSTADAVDLQTALNYATAGQTVLLEAGTYDMSNTTLTVQRGRDGTEADPIEVKTDDGYATLDFGGSGKGLTVWGNYWNFSNINITGTADGSKGMQLAGSHCVLERMNFYNNGNTGLQVSGLSSETIDGWPSYNTITNCTSMNNADKALEDADGFAAKLTTGEGNVFDGCISAYNADDGWDLFAKVATGSIGAVTIKNCVTYRNGYLMVKAGGTKEGGWSFAEVTCDENGTLTIEAGAEKLDAGNGNGFKMGGSNMSGKHKLINSISYENKAKGIDSNSGIDIEVSNSTSYNNGSYNVALYTSDSSKTTAYVASGILSFRKDTNTDTAEQLKPQTQKESELRGENNYYWDTKTQTSHNSAEEPTAIDESWFESLDTSVEPTRDEDGNIDMHGLLLLTEEGRQAIAAGARGSAWGQDESNKATIWVVGDSTVSKFSDSYYIPREGYGEELSTYFNATVYNLAHSGASSKDYTTMTEYDTLRNGSTTVPALSSESVTGDKFLIIGFGHNDEKTEAARYTNPNGDYKTEGSFANSLYVNYIKPALDAGVTPVVCTPIARLTDTNTTASYNSASGHITKDTVVGDTTYAGGDYAQAIRDMCEALKDKGVICIDLTDATIKKNVELGENAQWLHAFTGAKKADDSTLTATGLDKTHTNSYGAKMNAWLISQLAKGTKLGTYSQNKAEPTYKDCFASAINADYKPVDYTAPESGSTTWTAYTDTNGTVWSGSVFGDVGGVTNVSTGNFTATETADGALELKVANNCGKIASGSDGMIMYYVQLPAGTAFTLTATATVNDLASHNQVSFGLMARDDMYIDSYVSSTMGDYVAVGSRSLGAVNCFGRKSTALYNGPTATKKYGAGDEIQLKLVGTADGFTLTYGENEPVSAGFDYALTAIDPDHIYVGLYVVRNADVTFSNICLTINEIDDEEGGEEGEQEGEQGGNTADQPATGKGKNNTGLIVAGAVAAAAVVGGVVLARNWSKLPVHVVSGTVTNGTENGALRDVTITLLKDGEVVRTVTTGASGSYRMFVPQGEYTLQASYTDATGKTVTTSQTLEAPAKNLSLTLAA